LAYFSAMQATGGIINRLDQIAENTRKDKQG
jgi:hypothetical protein